MTISRAAGRGVYTTSAVCCLRHSNTSRRADNMTYETPTITELGSVADFTRADSLALDYDGKWFRGDDPDPTS
jgi:hypothetical protein